MECEHQKMSRNDFKKIFQFYSSRKELLFFLFNTLNLILNDGENYCHCKKCGEKKRRTKKNVKCVKCQLFFEIPKKI